MSKSIVKFIGLFFSTVVVIGLFVYQNKADFINAKFFKHLSQHELEETQLEYFQRIGKTDRQIRFDTYTTIGLNALSVMPFVFSVITKNPIMYITYSGSIVCASAIAAFGKKIFKEARPDDQNDLTSFPSGHSTLAFNAASVFLLCARRKKYRTVFGCLFTLTAILVAVGRVLANRHWPVDVLAGMAIGCLSASLSYLIVGKINAKLKLFKYNNAVVDKADI